MTFKLQYPVGDPVVIKQYFGENTTGVANFYTRFGLPAHEGLDFGGDEGDPIYAAADGTITEIRIPGKGGVVIDHAYGKHVRINHIHDGEVYQTSYAHLSNVVPTLRTGMQVKVGDLIGYMGKTGNTRGVHLHFMLKRIGATAEGKTWFTLPDGRRLKFPKDIIDPLPYLAS